MNVVALQGGMQHVLRRACARSNETCCDSRNCCCWRQLKKKPLHRFLLLELRTIACIAGCACCRCVVLDHQLLLQLAGIKVHAPSAVAQARAPSSRTATTATRMVPTDKQEARHR